MNEVIYHESSLPEHEGNPLIEALPAKEEFKKVLKKLSHFPEHCDEQRSLPAEMREEYLYRLRTLRLPLPEYRHCFKLVRRAIVEGYIPKNPFSPTTNHYIHHYEYDRTPHWPATGVFEPNGQAITILGESGIGKSKMVWQVLNYFKQVIPHDEYKGRPFKTKQVVWLYIELPSTATRRGVCENILDAIDKAVGQEPTKPNTAVDTLILQVHQMLRRFNVGILAVDELQNLTAAKSGGAEQLLNFLLELINKSGVPLLLCGNPEVEELLQKKFRVARRAEAGGYISMGVVAPRIWPAFMSALWPLQWTNEPTALTQEFSDQLYKLSAGILEIAVRVYHASQDLVIGTNDERITAEVLEEAYHTVCKMTDGELVILRDELGKEIGAQDYASLLSVKPLLQEPKSETSSSAQSSAKGKRQETICGDVTRVQHPEFLNKFAMLKSHPNKLDLLPNPSKVRDIVDSKDKKRALRREGLILENPLESLDQ